MMAAADWLGRAAQAGRLAADRAELWIPGAIGSLAYIAWLPLVLVVASVPRVSDITFLGADLYSSPLYPFNVLLLAVLLALLVVTACALAALGEAFLLHGDDVFLASDGEIVQRKYKVISISANSILVEDMANNNRQTLPLLAR